MSDLNTKKLDALIKALSEETKKARVGILGDKNTRSDTAGSNAEIGYKHEFGLGVLERSFLRVPIIDNFQKYVAKAGILKKAIRQLPEKGTEPFLSALGIIGVRIVADGFDSGGFGKWPPWKNPNYDNRTGELLKDTLQLQRSIEWDVK